MVAQIVLLAATLADTQERLQKVAARLEEDDETKWESRYEELRVAQTEAVNSAKWLRAQNIELKQKVAKHKPEMDRALSAREAAFRKLKHARKVIRDLLAERVRGATTLFIYRQIIDIWNVHRQIC